MIVDNFYRNGEAKAHANTRGLGREKWFLQVNKGSIGKPHTIVGGMYLNCTQTFNYINFDLWLGFTFHNMDSVFREVNYGLFQLNLVYI
ncbi:MAG: hypothetical protein ACI84R_001275 [Candidatus Azotimanducaceae bacterium]|jgi:hypothetical protein